MKECNLTTKMRIYKWEELTDEQRALIQVAKEMNRAASSTADLKPYAIYPTPL